MFAITATIGLVFYGLYKLETTYRKIKKEQKLDQRFWKEYRKRKAKEWSR